MRDVRLEMRDWKRNARDERVCGVLDVRGEGCCGDKSGSPTYKCRNCRHIFATSSQVLLNPVLGVIFFLMGMMMRVPSSAKISHI